MRCSSASIDFNATSAISCPCRMTVCGSSARAALVPAKLEESTSVATAKAPDARTKKGFKPVLILYSDAAAVVDSRATGDFLHIDPRLGRRAGAARGPQPGRRKAGNVFVKSRSPPAPTLRQCGLRKSCRVEILFRAALCVGATTQTGGAAGR